MLRRPSSASVLSVIAVVLAAGGTSYAAVRITGRDVKDGSLTGRDVRDGSLRAKDFAKGQLPAGRRGPEGAQGPAGPRGFEGPTGPAGPGVHAYNIGGHVTPDGTGHAEMSVIVPPGSYALTAKANVTQTSPGDGRMDCTLFAGGVTIDEATVDVPAATPHTEATLIGTLTTAGIATPILRCATGALAGVDYPDMQIVALQVAGIN